MGDEIGGVGLVVWNNNREMGGWWHLQNRRQWVWVIDGVIK